MALQPAGDQRASTLEEAVSNGMTVLPGGPRNDIMFL